MKTFKLKQLIMMLDKDNQLLKKRISFVDGLLIDREDDKDDWLIEVYLEKEYLSFFQTLEDESEILMQVKISKESNDPAFFVVSIIQIVNIFDRFSVLFKGKLLKRQMKDMVTWVQQLIRKGYYGKQLIQQLKQLS